MFTCSSACLDAPTSHRSVRRMSRFLFGRNRQRGSEGYHGPESAVEAENKLVEVCLQILLAYTMMDSQQLCIEELEHCSITGYAWFKQFSASDYA